MSLRVLESDSHGRWRDGQPSWDSTYQRNKQSKGQNHPPNPDQDQSGLTLYNAKGNLVSADSSLKIDV